MRRRIGELWIAIGVLHFLIILLLGWNTIGKILGDGYVNAISDSQRAAVFWLFFLGAPFLLFGVLARWAQRRVGRLPESVGWIGLCCFTLGVLAVPASGFWLAIALSAYTVVVARQDARRSPAEGPVRS